MWPRLRAPLLRRLCGRNPVVRRLLRRFRRAAVGGRPQSRSGPFWPARRAPAASTWPDSREDLREDERALLKGHKSRLEGVWKATGQFSVSARRTRAHFCYPYCLSLRVRVRRRRKKSLPYGLKGTILAEIGKDFDVSNRQTCMHFRIADKNCMGRGCVPDKISFP